MVSKVDTDWFKKKLRDLGLSQRQLAKIIDMDFSAVSRMLTGKRKITLEDAVELSRGLRVPLKEVTERAGLQPGAPVVKVPLVAAVSADGSFGSVEKGSKHASAELELPDTVLAAHDEEPASPFFGWTFFYEPRISVDADCVGRLCVVELPDGNRFLRFLKPAKDRGGFQLLGLLAGAPETSKVKAASPVLWIRS